MRQRVGELWMGLGVLHFAVILLVDGRVLGDIVGDGYVDAVGSDLERNAVFWLFYLGVPFIFVGLLLRWAQRVVGAIPESVGWVSLGCFALGALAVPASGFWLGVILAGYTVVVARGGRRTGGEAVTASRMASRSGRRP